MFKRFFENVIKPKDNFGGRLMLKSMNKGHEKLASWGRSFLQVNPGDRVLDLGCGGGRNIEYFLSKTDRVYGLDYSKTSVEVASNLNKEAIRDGRCQILEGHAKKIPFADGSMDLVTAFETIYFWKPLDECFREIYRVLKEDGQFFICNEAASPDQENIKKWVDMLKFEVYSPEDLTIRLSKIGFSCQYHVDQKGQLVFLARKQGKK